MHLRKGRDGGVTIYRFLNKGKGKRSVVVLESGLGREQVKRRVSGKARGWVKGKDVWRTKVSMCR